MKNKGLKSLQGIIAANLSGRPLGIYAVCSAHPLVLEAAIRQGVDDDRPVLIEATANQINQFGGYTGMRPDEFPGVVERIARKAGAENERIVLGGDHLGPICWTAEPAKRAMAKACELVAAYARAGFGKIHLDTSMACADDPELLPERTVAGRAAELCRTAERAARDRYGRSEIIYVIGTEVPAAGGEAGGKAARKVTDADSAARTIGMHREAFREKGLGDVWERVIGLVVEPGVGFDNDSVFGYEPQEAAPLKALAGEVPGVAYEAHSTDYQTFEALAGLVRDHFAILKVGPELTYALRQGLFALSCIEAELIPAKQRANLPEVCEQAMLNEPAHWRAYCKGAGLNARLLRRFGYSDRIRYYWRRPEVAAAVERLKRNLAGVRIPLPLLDQFLPLQFEAVRNGVLEPTPERLVLNHVMRVTGRYARACAGNQPARTIEGAP